MCNYCGCRAIEPIARLTAEHEQILVLSRQVVTALARDDHSTVAAALSRLRNVLDVHDAVEELAVYPAMEREPEFSDSVGRLFDEHDDLDQVITEALRAVSTETPDRHDWDAVRSALETLTEHIDHEKHGLFPAAAVCLDPADWERASAVRREHRRRTLPARKLERTL
jgi:hemerythrin-like domain-containing protein